MLTIANNIKVKCKKCGKSHELKPDDFSEDCSSDERNMGSETQYTWTREFICENKNICKNVIEVTIEGWEYPEGILNYQDSHVSGGSIQGQVSIEVKFDE